MEVVLHEFDGTRVVTVSSCTLISALGNNLLWGGRALNSDLTLADYGIVAGAELHESRETLGGKKKRKKKPHTTPKVKPHIHRKVKLAVLKYFKIEGDKVSRLKQ
jgi:small subunit ribosomal protein S27Ae